MGNVALTTLPVMIFEMDKSIARNKKKLEATEWTNIGAFKWWFVTLVFNVMFIIMHAVSRHCLITKGARVLCESNRRFFFVL